MEIKKVFIVEKYSTINSHNLFNIGGNAKSSFELVKDINICDIYIAFDFIDVKLLRLLKNKRVFKVLVRNEPKIVVPENYKSKNTSLFNYIIDVGRNNQSAKNALNWPQDLSSYNFKTDNRSGRIVMINSNLLSLNHGENYSLRRCAAKRIKGLDLYGFQWNNSNKTKILVLLREVWKFVKTPQLMKISGLKYFFSNYSNYLGIINNKNLVLSKYKYSLIIENSSEYISEKIFDSFSAGCIPIYIGPNLKEFGIPGDLYFQAEPNLKSIEEQINKAHKINYQTWIDNLHFWWFKPETRKEWEKDFFAEKLEELILKNYQ